MIAIRFRDALQIWTKRTAKKLSNEKYRWQDVFLPAARQLRVIRFFLTEPNHPSFVATVVSQTDQVADFEKYLYKTTRKSW